MLDQVSVTNYHKLHFVADHLPDQTGAIAAGHTRLLLDVMVVPLPDHSRLLNLIGGREIYLLFQLEGLQLHRLDLEVLNFGQTAEMNTVLGGSPWLIELGLQT